MVIKFRHLVATAAFAAAAITATPALAAKPVEATPAACSTNLGSFTPAASDCSGWFAGNLLGNSSDKVAGQIAGLDALGFDTTGFDFNDYLKIDSLNGSQTIDFETLLSGPTIIGIHFGAGQGGPGVGIQGGVTGFFLFNIGTPIESITTALSASSGAVLYQTGNPPPAVPEPGTWAMMLLGFGAIGFSMRSRRRRSGLLAQAA